MNPSGDQGEWLRLFAGQAGGTLSNAERAQLEQVLRDNGDARRLWHQQQDIEIGLAEWAQAQSMTVDAFPVKPRPQARPAWRYGWAAAAVLVMAWALWWNLPSHPAAGGYVATLAGAEGCQWAGGTTLTPGQRVAAGSLKLEKGHALIHFDGGARMVVLAPAELIIESPGAARVHAGRVLVHAPEEAAGFQVETAEGSVVDLGTEFLLSVDAQGATECHVLEGEVEWHPAGSRQVALLAKGEARRYRNGMGETIALAPVRYHDFLPAAEPETAKRHLLAYEPFDYAEGTTASESHNGGFGWRSPWVALDLSIPAPIHEGPMRIVQDHNIASGGLAASVGGRFVFSKTRQWEQRMLPANIDLGQDGVYYVSFIASGPPGPPNEHRSGRFQVNFFSSTNYREHWLGFAVSAANVPYLSAAGSSRSSSDALPSVENLFVVCKIVASRAGADQLFMKVYAPTQPLDASDTTHWTVASAELNLRGSLDCLVFSVESNLPWATPWSVDDVRFGTSWQAVVPVASVARR